MYASDAPLPNALHAINTTVTRIAETSSGNLLWIAFPRRECRGVFAGFVVDAEGVGEARRPTRLLAAYQDQDSRSE